MKVCRLGQKSQPINDFMLKNTTFGPFWPNLGQFWAIYDPDLIEKFLKTAYFMQILQGLGR